jgi:hypothetical protein
MTLKRGILLHFDGEEQSFNGGRRTFVRATSLRFRPVAFRLGGVAQRDTLETRFANALRLCARKFFDMNLTVAAEVDDLPAGGKGPVGGRGWSPHKFRITNRE